MGLGAPKSDQLCPPGPVIVIFHPALTRSMHYVAHPGLRKAIGNFLRERRNVNVDHRGPGTGTAQGTSAVQRRNGVASGTSNPGWWH